MAIPKGITRRDVLKAIRDFDRRVPHPYGPSTRYDLLFERRRYPPKAIVGLAARRLRDGVFLDPDADFSGGAGPSAANRVLTDLGFRVVSKAAPSSTSPQTLSDWTPTEVDTLLPVYFGLLHHELDGDDLVKRTAVREVLQILPGRTRGSVEYKFENVSAILHEEGLPWVDGYKPAGNYQQLLRRAVLRVLDGAPDERSTLVDMASRATPGPIPGSRIDQQVDPPKQTRPPARGRAGRRLVRAWRGAEADAANRKLGKEGEEWVVGLERQILIEVNRADLAARVEQVSETRGDGDGYDVLSFRPTDGRELWLEVKTTNGGRAAPFLLTRNELGVWRDHQDSYQLVRLFNFAGQPRFYRLTGDPDGILELDPEIYRAWLR